MASNYNPMELADAIDVAKSNSISQPGVKWYVYPVKADANPYDRQAFIPANHKPNDTGYPVSLWVDGKKMQISDPAF